MCKIIRCHSHGHTHVFNPVHGGYRANDADFYGNVLDILGAKDTISDYFGCGKVSCLCGEFFRVVNQSAFSS